MVMNEQDFKDAIAELESFYGGNILNGGILEATWYEALKKLNIGDLQGAIAKCFRKHPRKYNYFPSPDEILELARDGIPRENSQSYAFADYSKATLPVGKISPEELEDIREANRKEILIGRLFLLSAPYLSEEEKQNFHQKIRQFETYEIEQMISTAKQAPRPESKGWTVAHDVALNYFEKVAGKAKA